MVGLKNKTAMVVAQEGYFSRRQAILVLLLRAALAAISLALVMVLASGVALAVSGNPVHCEYPSQNPLTPECIGTDKDDYIKGRDVRDIIYAKGGGDFVLAYGGDDEVYGSAGRDGMRGGGGDDKLSGGDNSDTLDDREANDEDVLRGNRGSDSLDAHDSDFTDTIICGPGDNDTAYFDWDIIAGEIDTVDASCENAVLNDHPDPTYPQG